MYDFELEELIEKEKRFYLGCIDLIAASNAPTQIVRDNHEWSVAQFRSAEGHIGKRPYAGTQNFDDFERLAARRACDLFHADHCNVQPISGSMANIAVYKALLKPGDKILSMSMESGGHITHGHKKHLINDIYQIAHYQVDPYTYLLDYDAIRQIALTASPKLIIAGYSAYPRTIDFAAFKQIGDEIGAYVMADISHICGLVAGGYHSNPCESNLVVTSSVEKTLRGTRGGFILCPKEYAQRIDSGIFPGLQSSIGLDSLVTKAHLFLEVQSVEFREYIRRVIENAKQMATVFLRCGISVLTNGTDTHMMILNVARHGLSGREVEKRLEEVGILSNRNMIPYDVLPPFEASGLRLGTSAVTARGYQVEDMEQVAEVIAEMILVKTWSPKACAKFQKRVLNLVSKRRENDSLWDLLTGLKTDQLES